MFARKFHLIDIENLVGMARPSLARVRFIRDSYLRLGIFQPGDLFAIACNHGAAGAVGFGWPGGRLLRQSGKDGADLALLGVLEEEKLVDRFGHVVIASGDHIFAKPAVELGRAGIEVTAVAPPLGISRDLKVAAARTVDLFDVHGFGLAA